MKIAVDGPAGAGKSTIAKAIAKKLHINYLDTGAMYRTCAYALISRGIDVCDVQAVLSALPALDIRVEYLNQEQRMLLDETDVSDRIRTQEIAKGASDVAVIPEVRKMLVAMQRDVAKRYDIIMDGRDIGTYVLPDADYKFYITASSAERARRRYLEMQSPEISLQQLEQEIIARDRNDMQREFAPLRQAEDAILVDTTSMNIEEVVAFVLNAIKIHE